MRVHLFLLLTVLVCACTGNEDTENNLSAKKYEVISKIDELANDYGLHFVPDENLDLENFGQEELSELEKNFKGLSKISGTYVLQPNCTDGSRHEMVQTHRSNRKRLIISNPEMYFVNSYNLEGHGSSPDFNCTCTCVLLTDSLDNIKDVIIEPVIGLQDGFYSNFCYLDNKTNFYTWSYESNNTIGFNGTVHVDIISSNSFRLIGFATIYYSGFCGLDGGKISWLTEYQ